MKNKIFLVLFIGVALGLSACATSGNLPQPMIINNGPPPNAVQKDVPANADAVTLKPFKMEMLDEKSAKAPASVAVEQPTAISQSVEARISRLETEVKKHGTLLMAHQKILLKHGERISWLERYQRKIDAKTAMLVWNGLEKNLRSLLLSGFIPGTATLNPRGKIQAKSVLKRLQQIDEQARAEGKNLSVTLEGHASVGGYSKLNRQQNKAKNQAVSLKRAQAVEQILKKGGIKILSVKGMGETDAGAYGSTNQCVRILPQIQ